MPELTRVALVGIGGFGMVHRTNLARLADRVTLVAAVDVVAPEPGTLADTVQVFASLEELLAAVTVDVVIIATPTNTHAHLAETAMRAGADVYLEKPTAASLNQFDSLVQTQQETGRALQVGFQSLGSHALGPLMDGSLVGEIQAVGATGAWVRPLRYWSRAAWAGRRTLGGDDVVDGVVTNPLAHAVATALTIAGARDRSSVERIDLDLYRANDIEADDTSVVRITPQRGPIMTAALTLCAQETTDPVVTVHGELGSIRFHYTRDEVELVVDGVTLRRWTTGRTDLLPDLLRAREAVRAGEDAALVSSLADASAFTAVLDAVRSAPAPHRIPADLVEWLGAGDERRPVIPRIEELVAEAAATGSTFAELGTDWARR